MRAALLLLTPLTLALGACSTPPPPPQGMPDVPMSRAYYACSDGADIEMRFFPLQGVGVLIRHGRNHELQQQPAASGFLYTNGSIRVQGKGDELMLEIGRMVPITCRVSD
ncbi:MliC family protein [Tepidicella baoligensis]|uniref:MliC family protein n=1 Tax=Tepidicella baoligensis TaxID=2707016 RepID=UPI001C5C8D26|nr:MliC family protein [Tepidicella baoligensis]